MHRIREPMRQGAGFVRSPRLFWHRRITALLTALLIVAGFVSPPAFADTASPSPLLSTSHAVKWWFVFKLNAGQFPGCGDGSDGQSCPFGGQVQHYAYGQQFVYASSEHVALTKGSGCSGDSVHDPVGATFDEIYSHAYHYVIWNDQFYGDPDIAGCGDSCGAPWGHSKGLLAWNDAGTGLVMQVSTPSWPAAGSKSHPRQKDGNTLGCILDDDVKVSQHFFALKLTKADVVKVLKALQNASVVTDPSNPQIVANGGPSDIQALVQASGKKSTSTTATLDKLSSGVQLISKPSKLPVPPWQLVSSLLGGSPLRVATWWTSPKIPATTVSTSIACWNSSLAASGPVDIATSGHWEAKSFSLLGGPGNDRNHAKIGASTSGIAYSIFGDMNQQGALSGNCSSSQNGRGGLFYVIRSIPLNKTINQLISPNPSS